MAIAGGPRLLQVAPLTDEKPETPGDVHHRQGDRHEAASAHVRTILVLSALTPLEHADPAGFARTVHVGLTARWWLSQGCLPLLRASDAGRLVFLVDPAPAAAPAYWGGYGIVQPALEALAATLQAETASSSLRVHVLRPGPLRTPLRARAYAADGDRLARDPAAAADDCIALLAPGPAPAVGATVGRTTRLAPRPTPSPGDGGMQV